MQKGQTQPAKDEVEGRTAPYFTGGNFADKIAPGGASIWTVAVHNPLPDKADGLRIVVWVGPANTYPNTNPCPVGAASWFDQLTLPDKNTETASPHAPVEGVFFYVPAGGDQQLIRTMSISADAKETGYSINACLIQEALHATVLDTCSIPFRVEK